MAVDNLNLSDAQKDFLKEISNIGAGNGATALAQLTGAKILMEVPRVNILPFEKIVETFGGAEKQVSGIFLRVDGQAPCNILFLFDIKDAFKVADLMLKRNPGTTTQFDSVVKSTLEEMGNIVSGSFLAALSSFTKIRFYPSVPSLAIDMVGALINAVLLQYGHVGDQAMVIETTFTEKDQFLNGHFFLLPDPGAFEIIMKSLGVPSDE